MPCWEVRTMSVEIRAKHRKLLEQAIEALGWKWENIADGILVRIEGWFEGRFISNWDAFTINLASQKAEIEPRQQGLLNNLKQQYSKQALMRAAKLRGWQFKQQGQMKGVLRK